MMICVVLRNAVCILWFRASHSLTCSSPVRLEWLVIMPQGSSCPWFPALGLQACHHVWDFTWVQRFKLISSYLQGKCFTDWAFPLPFYFAMVFDNASCNSSWPCAPCAAKDDLKYWPLCLHLPCSGTVGLCHHTHFYMMLRRDLEASFVRQALYQLSSTFIPKHRHPGTDSHSATWSVAHD